MILAVDPFDLASFGFLAQCRRNFTIGTEKLYRGAALKQVVHLSLAFVGVASEYDSKAVHHIKVDTVIARHYFLRFPISCEYSGRADRVSSADWLKFFDDEIVVNKIPDSSFLVFTSAVNELALIHAGRFGDLSSKLFTFIFGRPVNHCEV